MKLEGKIALITGGTTGIGAATARLFKAEGATVVVTGSTDATVEAARPTLPGVEVVVANQADTNASKALIDDIVARHGRIDVLFVNAGVGKFGTLDVADEPHFDSMFSINVRGLYFLVKHAAPALPDGGAILLNSSIAASLGMPGMSVYSATKAAVRSLGRSFAAELAPRKIRVNVISPGWIETPIFGKLGLTPAQVEGYAETLKAKIPLGRLGQPEEIAAAALFLAADAPYSTGSEVIVGGGLVDI